MTDFDLFENIGETDKSLNGTVEKIQHEDTTLLRISSSFFDKYLEKGRHPKLIKNQTLHVINYTATEFAEARDATKQNKKDNEICSFKFSVVKKFLLAIEMSFGLSRSIFEVIRHSSCCLMIIGYMTKTEDQYKFTYVGGSSYACSPSFGVLVPLLLVEEEVQNKGFGVALLQCLQYFCNIKILNYHMLIWVATPSSKLIAFYRKLNFHPTISSQYAIEHILPAFISNVINATG